MGSGLIKKLDYQAAGVHLGSNEVTVEQFISDYLKYKAMSKRPLGRSSIFSYKVIQKTEFARKLVSRLTSRDIIDFALERQSSPSKPGPVTIAIDISLLRKLLRIAKPMFDISAGEKPGEYNEIIEALNRKQNVPHCRIPYCDLFILSILTCCRIGELCDIRWDDVDFSNNTLLVRNRKNPNGSEGNYSRIPLLAEAPQLLKKQPQINDKIFPLNSRSVAACFRRTLKQLGIENLRYHDLRREGATRLIEQGYSVEEAAMVTGRV